MEQEQQTPHKRRVRYKGKYPKKFEEKYKELQPENIRIRSNMSSKGKHAGRNAYFHYGAGNP